MHGLSPCPSLGYTLRVPYEPGSVIAGKYRVERLLGEGGMGIVLAARHLGLDEMVAVKLIREERAKGTDALARFQREARAAARIKSEHVGRVLDVDRLPEGDPYIVMEFIDGTDLHALVDRRGKLPPDEAAAYVVQACEGLAEAHALGMVHRDLKLKNLFLTQRRDGRALIKVIDFGVVKFSPLSEDDDPNVGSSRVAELGRVRARDATLTGAAVLVGSVHYMAPEQIRASNIVDARADVWSLGICLFEMLTGQLPFDGNTVAEVCAQIQGATPPDVRAYAEHLPATLAAVITRALEKDVRRRYQNVGELGAALAPFHNDRTAAMRIDTILESGVKSGARSNPAPAPTSSAASPTMTQDMAPAPGRFSSTVDAAAVGSLPPLAPPTKKRSSTLTGALLALGIAGIIVAVYLKRPAPETAPPPQAAQTNMPPPAPTPTPEPVLTQTAPTIAPTAVAEPPPLVSTQAPAKPPNRRGKGTKPAAAPAPKSDPAPKPEPTGTGAYDHF